MKYFTLQELSRSQTAQRLGLDNTPTPEAVVGLTALVENVLDPLRQAYGKPIRITSGYRSYETNKAVGGSKTSQHKLGQAADFVCTSPEELEWCYNYIKEHLPYDQLINEHNFSWIHVSYRADGKNRHEAFALNH